MSDLYKLEITFDTLVQSAMFSDKESAYAELEKLKPFIGPDYYERNQKDRETHVINSPAGDIVVATRKIVCARVMDLRDWEAIQAEFIQERFEKDLAFKVREREALLAVSAPAQSTTPPNTLPR